MKSLKVVVTQQAMREQDEIFDFICNVALAPLTAYTYITGLQNEIELLGKTGASLSIDYRLSEQLGRKVYRRNYKRVAIIYSVEDDAVYIHHIIPQSMIK